MATNTKLDQILRVMARYEKDAIARAQELAKSSIAVAQAALQNQKVQAQLRRLGVPSQSEVCELNQKIAKLEAELAALKSGQPTPSTNSPH